MSEETTTQEGTLRYFVSYSGIKLPLNLVTPLEPAELQHRNTYIRAWYDDEGRLLAFEKLAYKDIELAHRYSYYPSGALREVVIVDIEGEEATMSFDENGQRCDRE